MSSINIRNRQTSTNSRGVSQDRVIIVNAEATEELIDQIDFEALRLKETVLRRHNRV